MPHFTESEIEEVKRLNRLEDIARAAGCELRKHGVNKLVTRCMFHKENTPSLVIDVVRNTFKCFGCGKSGDVIAWVMETEGRDFVSAVERLAQGSGFRVQGSGEQGQGASNASKKSSVRTEQLFDPEMTGEEMLERTARYYHEVGLEAPELREYLVRRGLLPKDATEEFLNASGSMLEFFKLGYANRTLGLKVEKGDRVGGAEVRRQLQEIGVLRSSGHEHLAGSLVVPICDEEGRVVQLYGRKILDNLRQGTPKHLYLAGPLKGIFNVQGLHDYLQTPDAEPRTLILCEAILDALTFWVHGFQNVTACFGVTNFTEELLQFIVKYCFSVVYLAFDPDEPGDRGAFAVAEKLAQYGIECRRVKFPSGLDANEFALKVSNPTKALGELLDLAEPSGSGFRVPGSDSRSSIETFKVNEATVPTPPLQPAIVNLSSPTRNPEPGTRNPALLNPDDFTLVQGDRSYRIRGLAKSLSPGVMKVNLRVVRGDDIHLDTLDLCSHKQREQFARAAAIALNVKPEQIGHDLKRVLVTAEDIQDEQVTLALTPKPKVTELTDDERSEALEFLRSPDLIGRIVEGFAACGVVGEETNLLVGYLGAVSRLLERPLGILIQSSSAAGKTSLMDAVLAMMPKEAKVKYSAMTGQSLFYMGDMDLRHKILAIAEEEGAKKAEYSLKVLQSEGELTMAATGKNTQTGLLTTHQYEVKGPVMLFSTTTTIEIDEELLNRCIILTVNEDRAQTRAIHQRQRERYTVEGLWAKDDAARIRKLHQNAQRLLHPLEVVNPFARHLTFLDDKTRTRRDHEKYLTLIGAIALLHQHQRPIKQTVRGGRTKDYIEVQLADIALANRLANEVLGRSLDELPPQTRQLLMKLDDWVQRECDRLNLRREDFHFTRRALREALGWHDTQLRTHLERLVVLEYVLIHRGGRGQQFVYELLYDGSGKDGRPFVMNLIDVAALNRVTTDTSRGEGEKLAGSKRAENGPKTAGLRNGLAPVQGRENGDFQAEAPKNAHQEAFETAASYIRNGHSSSLPKGGK